MSEEDFIQEEYSPQKETYTESIKFNDNSFNFSTDSIEEKKINKEVPKKIPKKIVIEEADPEIIRPKPMKTPEKKKNENPAKKEETKQTSLLAKKQVKVEKKEVREKKPIFITKKRDDGAKKMKKNKKNTNKIIALIAILAIIGISFFIFYLDKIFPDQGAPVAVVNGQIITTKDVEQTLKTIPAMYKSLLTQEQILNQTITNTLLMQEANKAGVAATQEEVDAVINKTLSAAQISKDEFKIYLKEQNLTFEDMEEFYRTYTTIEKLLEKTAYIGLNVTQKEIKTFYNNNSDQLENVTLEEVESQIEDYLLQQKKAEAFSVYVNTIWKSADIRILNQQQPATAGNFTESNISSVPVEKYSNCAISNGIDAKSVIFVYSDSCPHCLKMKPIVTDLEVAGYKFKWAGVSDSEAKTLLSTCYSDVLAGGVPQFICAKNGQTIVGERTKDVLEGFAKACNN